MGDPDYNTPEEKLELVIGQGMAWNPMLAAIYSHLYFIPEPNLECTMEVLRNGHVLYNPMFIDACPFGELSSTILHGIGHQFTYEWETCVNYDYARYRIGIEHMIGEFIKACCLPLVPGWTYEPSWEGLHPAECLEFIGEVSETDAVRICPVRYPLRPEDYEDREQLEDRILPMMMHANEVAKSIGIGVGMFDLLLGSLLEPQLPWESELATFMSETLGRKGRSYRHPSRRSFAVYPDGETYLPGPSRDLDTVTIVIDVSGSVVSDPGLLQAFLSEIWAILQHLKKKCRVILHSSEVLDDFEAENIEEVIERCNKTGGTDFIPVFNLIAQADKRPACVVWLTDLFGTWPDFTPNYPLLWVVGKNHSTAPYGKILELPAQPPPRGIA